jgi:hypothetical protein
VGHLGGHRTGQEKVHEWGGDPVVEAALHVEQSTDAARDPSVAHDGCAEGRVCWSDDGPDARRYPQRDARDNPKGGSGPEADGEGQADGQQSDWQTYVPAKLVDVDPGRIAEQHQGQGHLGQ